MDSDDPQQPAVGDPAGQQLRRAREKLGLELNDIAEAQHLRVSIIQAIEDAHYDQIDSELFLKGYVRAYAKQVGVDADALIQSLDQELEPLRQEREKEEQEHPLVNIERRRRKKRQVAKTLLVILILAGVALAGWKLVLEPRMAADPGEDSPMEENSGFGETSGSDEIAESEPESGIETKEDPGAAIEALPEGNASPELAENSEPEVASEGEVTEYPELAEASGQSEVPVDTGGTYSETEVDTEAESVAPEDSVSDPQFDEAVTAEPIAQLDPVFEESAQPQSVAATVQLQMSFSSDCWVQVTDASGTRLVASLQREGDQFSVSGRAPLDVVVGAVDAVDTVSFDGEPVDLSNFRVVNNRTEFTLRL